MVLEAQASGLPVVVTDKGGPCENMRPDKTGFVVAGGDDRGFVRAVKRLAQDPEMRLKMGRAAREYMENRSFEANYLRQWDLYRSCTPGFA